MNYLLEDRRTELIARGRRGRKERDGKSRFEKRVKSKVSTSTKTFNQIDMNQFFKDNILTVGIEVRGETDTYIVTMSFGEILDEIRRQIVRDDVEDTLNLRVIIRALMTSFNKGNVYIRCSCPDFKYRQAYWLSVDDIIVGDKESRPSDITNPKNDLGPGCKHIMLVLSNTAWLIKVASVINNYIKYIQRNQERLYSKVIYPAIYGKKYEKPVQLKIDDIGDEDTLSTDKETIDVSNEEGRVSGRFKQGNPFRFTKKIQPDKDQVSIEDIEEEEIEDNE